MGTKMTLGSLVLFVLGAAAGCAATPPDENPFAGSSALSGVNLAYEGTCDFLHACSAYSRSAPPGEVSWGCTGLAVCSDADRWVAAPSASSCGQTVTLCNGSSCTTATVLDVSCCGLWEASGAVLDALGLSHGLFSGECAGGYGGGQVTISVGGAAAPSPSGSTSDSPPRCPGGGSYCGSDGVADGDPDTLYTCDSSGAVQSQTSCGAAGCHASAPGTPDACNAP